MKKTCHCSIVTLVSNDSMLQCLNILATILNTENGKTLNRLHIANKGQLTWPTPEFRVWLWLSTCHSTTFCAAWLNR